MNRKIVLQKPLNIPYLFTLLDVIYVINCKQNIYFKTTIDISFLLLGRQYVKHVNYNENVCNNKHNISFFNAVAQRCKKIYVNLLIIHTKDVYLYLYTIFSCRREVIRL